MSVSLSFISIPNYIDYVSTPVQIAQHFEGPAFYLGFVNHRADSLLLCISFRVKEYFVSSLIYTSSEASSLFRLSCICPFCSAKELCSMLIPHKEQSEAL